MGTYILILFLLLLRLLLLFGKEDYASIYTKMFLKEWWYAGVLIKMLCKKGEALFRDLVTQKQKGFEKCGLRRFHCTSYVQNYPTHYITLHYTSIFNLNKVTSLKKTLLDNRPV